ncbi:MAG: pilin [Candidatus Moraniibacteriota bacterium]
MNLSIKSNIFIIIAVFGFLLTASNASAASGLVPCGLGSNDPCTLCHLIVGTQGLIQWGMGILIALSITAISIAGVMYVVSSGDPTFIKQAKSFVTSTIIGFALMLGAWLIVNTTLWIFAAKEKSSGNYNLGLDSENWWTFTCSTVSSSTGATTTGQGGVAAEPLATNFDCANFNYQSGIKAQCDAGDASTELQTLMMCLKSKLGASMTINSISDSAGLSTCTTSYSKPPCAHTKSSCHYGGTAGGKSEAVDISTRNLDANTILSAATECGSGYKKNEAASANHIHISTTACKNN